VGKLRRCINIFNFLGGLDFSHLKTLMVQTARDGERWNVTIGARARKKYLDCVRRFPLGGGLAHHGKGGKVLVLTDSDNVALRFVLIPSTQGLHDCFREWFFFLPPNFFPNVFF
jgi:hypothetical protein